MANVISKHRHASLADLEAMPEADGNRYELLGGRIYVTPSPIVRHQLISRELFLLLNAAVPVNHELFYAPVDLDLVDNQRVVPDIVVIADEFINEKRLTGPALLVVEIVSPGTKRRDLGIKRDAYAASGVSHYWVIDGKADRVLAYRLGERGYETLLDQTGGEVRLREPIPVAFTLADLGRR
jgi:Uma2 family endonuclease